MCSSKTENVSILGNRPAKEKSINRFLDCTNINVGNAISRKSLDSCVVQNKKINDENYRNKHIK